MMMRSLVSLLILIVSGCASNPPSVDQIDRLETVRSELKREVRELPHPQIYTVPQGKVRVLNENEYAIDKLELQRIADDQIHHRDQSLRAREEAVEMTEAYNSMVDAYITARVAKAYADDENVYLRDALRSERITNKITTWAERLGFVISIIAIGKL
jgi:PBP1b-binding outer membrane lipoprotein LpoB